MERRDPADLAPGDTIAGKYAIVKVLGVGGMGIVYEATHLRLHQRVAVKMLQREMLTHEVVVTRFEREARSAAQLRSRHTAKVMDVDVTSTGLPYMVMEFLEGHDLEAELGQRGRLPLEEAVDYVLQACSAMIEAHRLGIVHRDLKPANLFLAVEGDSRIVKLLDFGISKAQHEGDSSLTTPDSVMGTALYMSPEQVRSSGTVDARSDIWALGVILYELLAGRTPWMGTMTQLAAAIVTEDPPSILAFCHVPPDVVSIIARALKRDPKQRFDDVKELAVALAPFAPASGAGRLLADGLLFGGSGSFPRVSLRPNEDESARTIVNAAAVSQAPSRGEGTAPGWSRHRQAGSKGRALVVGMMAAFGVGFVVLGLLALAWLRWGGSKPHDGVAAAPSAPPTVASVASVASSGTSVQPKAPAQAAPELPVTAAAASVSASGSAPVPRAHPPARPHASSAPAKGPPPLGPKPQPGTDSNGLPLHL